jgi:hypothetical protein
MCGSKPTCSDSLGDLTEGRRARALCPFDPLARGTPAPGAIAQWNGGSFGHVAYVEVVTDAYIEVTDDNYGLNTTDRWRINTTSPAWPDNVAGQPWSGATMAVPGTTYLGQ